MTLTHTRAVIVLLALARAQVAWAQTADDVVEKSLTAMGGRAAFSKIKSRSSKGTITISTPVGEVSGTVEVLNAPPNKLRTLAEVDLSAAGAGSMVVDTRFDGTSGFEMNSLQGNRVISGNQLDNLRNSAFPHPFLTYKAMGITIQLTGREKAGDRDAFVLTLEPPSGSVSRHYIDAETFLPLKTVMKVEVPQIGREVEQTTEYFDYRDVDGLKLPFRITASSAVQSFIVIVTKIEHNVAIDETLFSKPAAP